MAFVVETGAGTPGANAYVTTAFVDGYLADRNRETENEWSTQTTARKQEAIVAATSYIDKRWGLRFKGVRYRQLISGRRSKGTLTLASLPLVNETVTIGTKTYRFVDALAQENDVLRGATVATALAALEAAVEEGGDGTTTHADTVNNLEAEADVSGSTMTVTALVAGTNGDAMPFATDVTDATISGSGFLAGGIDEAPQPRAWPRAGAFTQDGQPIVGVPLVLKQATAEYAVRALAAELDPDPTVSTTGAAIQRKLEQVGPITEETEYVAGAVPSIHRDYPAADVLLAELITRGGGVLR